MEKVIQKILIVGYNKVKNYLLDGKVNEATIINEFMAELINEIKPQKEEENIQIEKDRSWEFDIGDLITFDNPTPIYIENSYDFSKFNTVYEVIGYNKPNNIKVKIIKDRDRESGIIGNINLSTEYTYITKLYVKR